MTILEEFTGITQALSRTGHEPRVSDDRIVTCSRCDFVYDARCIPADLALVYMRIPACGNRTGVFEYRRPTVRELLEGSR